MSLGHSEYPKRFDVDMTSVMLGEVKPYRRQLVVSTGKTDWTHDIMDAHLSLAAIISRVPTQIPLPASPPKVAHTFTRRRRGSRSINAPPKIPGIFTGADSARTAILNGSHKSLAEDPAQDTVLVFPDYRVISDVSRNLDDAYDLMEDIQTPVPAASVFGMQHRNGFRSWILPYSAVIMLCMAVLFQFLCLLKLMMLIRFTQEKRQALRNISSDTTGRIYTAIVSSWMGCSYATRGSS